jgi:nucleotide-binding universal stress UspA family protein
MRGLEVEDIFVVMPPVDAIQRAAETHKVDLIVMGSHGASGLEKLAMGSVAEAVLRHSASPVVILGPKCKLEPKPFESIVFATDLDTGSLRPAQYAVAMAEENNAKITLLHVVQKTSGEEASRDEEEMRDRMEGLLPADARHWSRPRLRVEHGDADKQVLEVASEEKADLIVMGTRVAGPLSDHVPWSTVSKVIRGANCPVMAVRAHLES